MASSPDSSPHQSSSRRKSSGTRKQKADYKVVILGDADVGKTSLIHRYLEGVFLDGGPSTIGCAFFLKQWKTKNVALWDTAGEEKFSGLSSFYCRGANAVILCYDVCKRATFTSIKDRYERLLDVVAPGCVMVLVGTKADMMSDRVTINPLPREVTREEAHLKSSQLSSTFSSLQHPLAILPVFEASAKTGQAVTDVFEFIFTTLIPPDTEQGDNRDNSKDNNTDKKRHTSYPVVDLNSPEFLKNNNPSDTQGRKCC